MIPNFSGVEILLTFVYTLTVEISAYCTCSCRAYCCFLFNGQPFHQPAEFLFCYLPCFIGISRPFVLSVFKSFVQQYAYLIKQRFIAPEVITHFAKKKLLYEDKKHHNAVFVGMDSSGTPRQAHKRSTTTFGNSFRQTIEDSDTKYSFAHFGKSNMLFVFEAPIDMLSFITLYEDIPLLQEVI